ncbi:MAG: type II secretion system protein [Pirellulaceae bacterium]
MPINQPIRRPAFTVLELLIVMGIFLLIAAVTLPTVKGLLEDSKYSQTSRLVQGFAESARARAIGSGRPVAMIIERMYADGSRDLVGNDSCIRLSIGEVFPPYEGDWADARATIVSNPIPTPIPNPLTPGFAGSGVLRGTSYCDIPFSQAASLWDPVNGEPSGLATPGDTITFGASNRSYRLVDSDGDTHAVSYLPPPLNLIRIEFDNPAYDDDAGYVLGEQTVFPSSPLRFRIYRKPSKSLVGGVSLPRGMCIDLSCSGGGVSGIDFGTASIAAASRGGSDPGVTHEPGVYGPVYIVFNATGTVQDVYYGLTPAVPSAPNTPEKLLVHRSVGSPIHLLVGSTDQVFPTPAAYLGVYNIPSPAVSAADDVRYNVLDPANYWVTISPFSGTIQTAKVQDQSVFPAPPANLTPLELLDLRIQQSRALAISGSQRIDP